MNFYNVLAHIYVYLIYRNIYVQCINTREGLRSPLGNFDNNTNQQAFKQFSGVNNGSGRFEPEFTPRTVQNAQSSPQGGQFAGQGSNRRQQFPANQFQPKPFDPKLLNSAYAVPNDIKSEVKFTLDALNATPKGQHHVFQQPTQLNLLTLDISKRRSSDVVVYHYDKATKTHTFTTKDPWLINRLVNEGKTVWVAEEKFGKQAIISRDASNQPFLTVLFPMDEIKPSVIGIDLMLFDVKKADKKAPEPEFKLSEFKVENNEANPPGANVAASNSTPSVKRPKNVTVIDPSAPASKQSKAEPVSEPPQPPEPRPKAPDAQPSAEQSSPSVPQPAESKQEPVSKEPVPEQPVNVQKPEVQKPKEPEQPAKPEPAPKEASKPNTTSNSANSEKSAETGSEAPKRANEPTQAVNNPPPVSSAPLFVPVVPSSSDAPMGTTEGVKGAESDSDSSSGSETDEWSEKPSKSNSAAVNAAQNELVEQQVKVVDTTLSEPAPRTTDGGVSEADVGETGAARSESSDSEYEPSVVGQPAAKKPQQPSEPYPAESSGVKTDEVKPTALDINNGSSTDFYDFFRDGDSAVFEPKDEYGFVSVQDGKAMRTIWKANGQKEYANRVVRTHSTFSNQSKLSVFLADGSIRHFVTSGDEWKERSNEVAIDIDVLANAHEYEYRSFENSLFFHSRYDFRFKAVKQKSTLIWSSTREQHANAVIVTDVDASTKLLVIQFSSPDMLLFRRQKAGGWQQDLNFRPSPVDLDIQYLKTAKDDIFTHIPSQGNVIGLIKQRDVVVWKAPQPEKRAKKVVVDRLDDGSVILTIYCLDGQLIRLRSPGRSLASLLTGSSGKFAPIDPSGKIPITLNVASVTPCRAYYNHLNGNVRVFRTKDDYVFVGVRAPPLSGGASGGSADKTTNSNPNDNNNPNNNQLVWHLEPSEYTLKYSNKVEFISYEKYEGMYELVVHTRDGAARRFFRHREAPWSPLDPSKRLPVSVNILSQYDSYKFTVRLSNAVKRFTAKPGIAFDSVIEWSDAKQQVWLTNEPAQYARAVEFDAAAGRVSVQLFNGEVRKLRKGADGKWVKDFGVAEPNTPLLVAPDKAKPAAGADEDAQSVRSGQSIRNWFRRGFSTLKNPLSQIKLYSSDPKSPGKRVELAKSLYQLDHQAPGRYLFVLRPDSKCAEVVYVDLIFDTFDPEKLLTTKPVSIWKLASGTDKPKFPKSLAFLYPNKILINFADSFIANEKASDGSWISRDFDVRFFSTVDDSDAESITGKSSDDDTSSVISFGESSPVQLPQNAYQLKRLPDNRYDYKFNPGVKCSEVKFYYKRLDPKDPTRVVSGYRTVWRLGQFGLDEFPAALSVRSDSRVVVEFENSFFVCERGSFDKWLVKQTYLELFTVQGNQLDPTLFKVGVSSEGLLYTLSERARCARVSFVESASDPTKSAPPSTHAQRLWDLGSGVPTSQNGQNSQSAQFPTSILYKNSGSITIYFEGSALDFEKGADGSWVSTQSHEYSSSSSVFEGPKPNVEAQQNKIHLKRAQGPTQPSNRSRTSQDDSQTESESEARATTSYTFRRASYPGAVPPPPVSSGKDSSGPTKQTSSQAEVSEHKAGPTGRFGNSNVIQLHSSEFPTDVAIELDKNSSSRRYDVFSNPGREFFLYQFADGARCTKITHAEHPSGSGSAPVRSDVKTVWAYGSGSSPSPAYPQSVFYNKLTLTFIIIFSDHNLILTKQNGSWVPSNTTKAI